MIDLKVINFKIIVIFLLIYFCIAIYLWDGFKSLLFYIIFIFIFCALAYFAGKAYGKFARKRFGEAIKFLDNFGYPQKQLKDVREVWLKMGLLSFIGTSLIFIALIINHFGYLEYANNMKSIASPVSMFGMFQIVSSYSEYKEYENM